MGRTCCSSASTKGELPSSGLPSAAGEEQQHGRYPASCSTAVLCAPRVGLVARKHVRCVHVLRDAKAQRPSNESEGGTALITMDRVPGPTTNAASKRFAFRLSIHKNQHERLISCLR